LELFIAVSREQRKWVINSNRFVEITLSNFGISKSSSQKSRSSNLVPDECGFTQIHENLGNIIVGISGQVKFSENVMGFEVST